MLSVDLARLKADITPKLKGTSLNEVTDFYGVAAAAANRMLARIDPEETIRIATLATPFYDNLQTYAAPSDYKMAIDIRPQAGRTYVNESDFRGTTTAQFARRMDWNSFAVGWSSGQRTLKAQRLPIGNVYVMDTFESATANGSWSAEGDASGLYTETLNFIQGNSALGMNLSGTNGVADIVNTTAQAADLSAFKYNDASLVYVYIPSGTSSRFTSFTLRRGSDASNYKQQTASSRADGTAFVDGWNLLMFNWQTASTVGSPDDTKNTYRYLGISYSAGTTITGFLVDSWTDALGQLFEIEYYSECLFRTAAGVWIYTPTADTDIVCVGPASYEILKAEMMIEITQDIRQGLVRDRELADWRVMLNGTSPNRYVRDPKDKGLYDNYLLDFPSQSIPIVSRGHTWDV